MHRVHRSGSAALVLRSRPALAWPVLAALALAGAACGLATPVHAQTVVETQQQAGIDPPGRVARLGYFDGNVSRQAAGENDWDPAQLNYPLTAGDRLATDAAGRAELHLGSSALRLGAGTQMEFAQLDDDRAFLTLMQGTLSLRVRALFPGQHLEVNTPNLAFSITQPGDYRVDVDPAGGLTRVVSFEGGGVAYGEGGQTQVIGAPQQIRFTGRNLVQVAASNGAPRDGFDQWALARDRQEDQSQSAQYVSREVVGYQQLDSYGSWSTDPSLGAVWYPRVTVTDWAPYRYGRWAWVAPWGWTWIDDAPWGFAPFHYGRWTQVGPRWGWVPGPRVARPYYAPALVAFVGGSAGGTRWSLSIGGMSQPGVAWFPLAPGEAYRPYYRASNTYITQINRTVVVNGNNRGGPPAYRFQRPDSVTAWGADDFRRGRPARNDFHRVTQTELDRARPGVTPDVRPPARADNTARPGNDRPWNDTRPGGPPPRQDDNRQADGRRPDDRRPDDARPGNRPDDRFDNRPGLARPPQPDLAEQQRRQIERAESRGSLTLEQRQQIQQQHDQQRRALADQQQQQLQNGAQRQQFEQQQRVQRQQDEQRERVERQQREMQDRVRRQQSEQQDRVRQQQMNMQQQMQQQQQRDRQVQLDAQRSAFEQQQRAQREQAQQQERAARQQQDMAARQREAQAQQQQQVQRGPQQRAPDSPRPERPRRDDRNPDDGRPGRG